MTRLVWRWRTCADPNQPAGTARIAHPLADRFGHECDLLAQGRNGNRAVRFDDGLTVVAPLYATRAAPSASTTTQAGASERSAQEEGTHPCVRCGGSGSVLVTYGDHPQQTDEDCPVCDGEGFVRSAQERKEGTHGDR